MMSNTLPKTFFSAFHDVGLNIVVERYSLAELVSGTRGMVWYDFRSFWNRSVFYPNHEADLLRMVLLHTRGGVYIDTDVIFTRHLPSGSSCSTNFIGVESDGSSHTLSPAFLSA